MNKLNKLLFASLVIFATQSCTDLDENLVGDITDPIAVDGIAPPDVGDGGGPLTAAYAELRNAGTANHGSYYSIQEITSDEMCIAAKGGDWFDGGILVELHQHTYGATHAFLNNAWNGAYGAINTVNELLAGGTLDDASTAQARVLRAYFYFRLMDDFGRIKLITSPGVDVPQTSRADAFNFIETELLEALDISEISEEMDLAESPLGRSTNAYQINTFGALGILTKLYLNSEVYVGEDHYSEAAIAASYIIDNGPYSLCGDGCTVTNLGKRSGVASDPDNLEGYAAVFAPNNDGNPEHIFTVNYDQAGGGGMNFSQMNLHYSSQFTWNLDAQPWNGYATLEEFYNSYSDDDARKATFIVGDQLDFGGNTVLDFASDDENIVLNYTPSINELQPNSQREAGARAGKYSFQQFGRPDMNNDWVILRLGDVILMRGEALARMSGNWNDALPDVNTIRARAKVADLSSIDADGFLAERGREMYQETARRRDLIRFGKYGDTWWEKPTSDDFRTVFPIPFDQIQASNSGSNPLTQNPGY